MTMNSGCLVCVLIEHQDVNAVDKNGWTALHFAAFHGRLGCIQLLLRWGGNADDVENSGCTAGEELFSVNGYVQVFSWHLTCVHITMCTHV